MQLPCLIPDMDFETYLSDPLPEPSLTSGLIRSLLTTAPRKIWEQTPRLNRRAKPENKTQFDLGSAAHALFTGEGDPIATIEADDYRTKAAKEARDAAYAEGKMPLLVDQFERVKAMAEAALVQVRDNPDLSALFAPDRFDELGREVTICWTEAGALHRCRPDFYDRETNAIIHYKTTGTDVWPSTLARYAASAGWDMTAAHYHKGALALTGKAPRQFFVVQEVAAPHLLMVAELDVTFLETAMMRRERAIQIWTRCLRENAWPGLVSRTVRLECPEWHERNLVAEKDAENDLQASGGDLFDIMHQWFAPVGWQRPDWSNVGRGDE